MSVGRPYVPAASSAISTAAQDATMQRLMREHDWTSPYWRADGLVEARILDTCGRCERIVIIARDGSTSDLR
jgi:hypothetical protein